MPRMPSVLVIVAGALASSFVSLAAADDQADLDFFESKIRPVLVEHCYACHSAKAAADKKLKGGLLVDTREGLRTGGESGPAVVPGKVEESLIIAALRHESFEMPPQGKLPDATTADFVKWIELGAPDPRDGTAAAVPTHDVDIDAGRQHWAFQPLHEASPPKTTDTIWPRTPIDRFIRAQQEAAGVSPDGTADIATLIRRAYYDVIGLPPSPADLREWTNRLAAGSQLNEQAYAELVDYLLDSEHFGERWGRHWLDLVRFAESNGYAFDKDRPNAFHYRDFVIRALNEDMPYDRFVRLQLAGDLLAPANPQTADEAERALELVAATGFLVAGPFTTQQTQKERERSRYEQLDDMAHTLGTSLLGLTVGCARCHTHKYDPLPVGDYYRLVSCFAEVGFSDTSVNTKPEAFAKAKAEFDAAHAPLVAARAKFETDELPGRLDAWLKDRPQELPAPGLGVWHHLGPFMADSFDKAFDEKFPPEQEKEIDLAKSHLDGKLKWTAQPSWQDGQVHNTLSGDNAANYLYRVVQSHAKRKLSLSLGSDDAIRLWVNGKEVLKNKVGRAAAPDQEKVDVQLEAGRNHLLMKIVNGAGPSGFYFKASSDGPPKEVAELLKSAPATWDEMQRRKVLDWYKTIDESWLELNSAVEDHQQQAPQPEQTTVYAAKMRGATYNFGGNTYKVFHLARGNADNKQDEATPGFLQVLMRDEASRWLDVGADDGRAEDSAAKQASEPPRVALAYWLTDTEHGAGHLLARVIVNRLWTHHFGRGIVATANDFGTRGQPPSHPQLLDWLAGELIRGGWRLKPIHRLIMTSSVYIQTGKGTPSGLEHDPENLLWWRRESRRLEAEVLRDALLAVSGSLDPAMYGKGTLDERSGRRSVYLTVKRSQLLPLLQLFDAPDAMQGVGRREESTVAPQALAMMNSPFVRDAATKFAAIVRPSGDVPLEDAIVAAYHTALSRDPTEDERAAMREFIEAQAAARGGDANAESLAVRDFCQLLFCMNEFIYVD